MRDLRTEGRGQKSEVGGRRSEDRSQRTDDGGRETQQGDEGLSPGMIRMNRMLGWEKPGDKDKVKTKFDIKIKDTFDLIRKYRHHRRTESKARHQDCPSRLR